jgi:uncharacterized protein YjbJ (UPF0337 family)
MNQVRFAGICKQVLGKFEQSWGELTNNRALASAGARAQLAGRIQARYGASQERAARQLKDLLERNPDLWNR